MSAWQWLALCGIQPPAGTLSDSMWPKLRTDGVKVRASLRCMVDHGHKAM